MKKLTMAVRRCTYCGTESWHNPSPKAERPHGRCVYCGYPPPGNGDSIKRAHALAVAQRQKTRAELGLASGESQKG